MSKSIALSEELYNEAAELAARDRVSVDEFVAGALTERLSNRRFIESRANGFSREEFDRALLAIPDVEPEEFDRRLAV